MLRINGLVRIANTVRAELGRGVNAQGKARLVQWVSRTVEEVGQMLNKHQADVRTLPGPSRAALQYLTSIQWDQVKEIADSANPEPAASRVTWPGLGGVLERVARRLAADIGDQEVQEIGQVIQTMSRRMETTIAREGFTSEQLSPATRELRGWFAWMSEPENRAAYRDAVARAGRILGPFAGITATGPGSPAPPAHASLSGGTAATHLEVVFRPLHHIYRMRRFSDGVQILLPTPMLRLDEDGFADLARLMFQREGKQQVVERMQSEAYADLMVELESLGGIVEQTRGAFHDLSESFDRVNARYFAGQMARPRLSWSASMTQRKFGHYDHVRDAVMVSSTLDQSRVPAFVVDYLMFHELLHKKHGVRWHNGKGYAHTAEFYAEERTCERYDEAEAWLERLARGQ